MISRNSFFFVEACPSSSLIRLIVNCFFTSLLYLFPDILAVLSLCGIALNYLPVPVTRKYLPSSAGQEKPVGISRKTAPSR